MKQIKITISPMGNPKVEALGFVGASCDAATKPIEDMLAGKGGGHREMKPEYYQTEDATQTQSW